MATVLDELLSGLDHQQNGRNREAEAAYQAVLRHDAAQPHALYLLGALYAGAGFVAEALPLLTRAAELRPDHAETRLSLGNALCRHGDLAAGIAEFRALVARAPHHRGGWVNLARALHADGQAGSAAALARDALLRWPDDAGLHGLLATCLLRQGQADAALEAALRALALDPDQAEGWFARGTALNRLGRPEAALAALTRAAALRPDHADSALNLGNACLDLDRIEDAERWIRRALALDPALKEAHASLGYLLTQAGRLEEAILACEAAIALDPGFAPGHWNLASACLLRGEYRRGWDEYEWRKRHPAWAHAFTRLPSPEWVGGELAGQRLLVQAEQGLGDTIQFSRYLPLLAARGAQVTLACDRRLWPLLAAIPDLALADRAGPLPAHDLWVDQMSLPGLFDTRPQQVVSSEGWLRPDPALVAAWATRLPPGPRVGLVWAGNPLHSNDRRRSLPPGALTPLLRVPGVSFVSLQVGPRAAEAAQMGVLDLSPALTDFAQTAAVIAGLDLVITVDSAVAHLTGALGRPGWVLLPHAPDWRWLTGCDDTPWYRSLHLFRQPAAGDWRTPVGVAAAGLARHLETGDARAVGMRAAPECPA